MKIIKRADVQDPRLGQKRCQRCGGIIEVERDDIPAMRLHRADPNDQRERDWWSISCPICGYDINLGAGRGW